MNKNYFTLIASLACFTLQSGALLEGTDYYVGTSTQDANTIIPSSCTDCTINPNSCCQLLDAFSYAGVSPVSSSNIYIEDGIGTITFSPSGGVIQMSNQYANTTLTSQNSTGTVIDFAGLTSTAGGLVVLQPTYNGTDSGSGSVILSNVVLQNGTVALAGGALTLSGTELPSSATFSSINLYVGAYQSQNPSLTFGVASSGSNYNSAFSGSITYYGTNTTLNLANNSGTSIVVSGNINNNTLPGCILDITGSNTVSVTGTITLDVVGTFTDVYLTPTSSNAIGSIFLHGGTLHVNSNNSLGGNPTINVLNTSTLSFEPGTYTESISDTIAYNADSTTLTLSNISGTAITLSGNINNSSYSGSVLTTVPTSGSLTLTGSIAVNTLNATAGTTYLFPDTGSGNSNQITTVNITGSNLRINSNQSFGIGAGTNINLNDLGELTLEGSFTSTNSFGSGYTINLNSAAGSSGANEIDDGGFIVQIDATIAGIGTYFKQGIGIQTLTQTNTYAGGTLVNLGTLSIANISSLGSGTNLTLQNNAGLYVSQGVTIPSGTSVTIESSGGTLSAMVGSTLTVNGPITASGILQIGSSSAVTTPNGTVYLTNSSNEFNSNGIIVGTNLDTNNMPAILSAPVTALADLGSLTLQYGGTFTSTTGTLAAPIYIGPSGSSSSGAVFSISSGNRLELTNTLSLTGEAAGGTTVHVYGPGILALSGNNSSFQGSWAVENFGSLEIESTDNLGSDESSLYLNLTNGNLVITGNMDSQRTLQLVGSDEISVSPSVTASFSSTTIDPGVILTKIGDGTLSILPSTQSAIPTLNVSAGAFVGNTLNLATTPITVSSLASVEFYQTSEGTFTGSISGEGYVSIIGTAPLTFSPSSSSYTGGTLISGPLIINQDNLGAFSAPLMMENGGSLTTLSSFSMVHYTTMTGNVTFSQQQGTILQMKGSFTGSGNLNKSGAGVLVLSGNSPSYTGKMYLNEGALIVNSNFSNSGDPIVGEGTIFAGTGTVGDTDVFGTLKGGSPTQTGGDPIGTLNINGSLELETGSYFGTLISPSGHSLVAATGPVTIHPNTSYLVGLTPGLYTGSDIVVLTGSSITGTFENIVSNGSLASYFFTHNIAYTDTEVVFAITKKSIVPLASGQNAINVATALDDAIHFNRTEVTFDIEPGSLSADPTPELPEILFSLLPLSSDPTAMTYALNELHPAQLKGLAISQESNMVQIREALSQRMQNELDLTNCASHTQADIECARHKKTMTPWMSIIGESLAQNTENNSWGPLTGYRANMGGFGAGIDGRFSENFYAGAMTGYTHSHLLWKADKGHGNISSGYAGLYLSGLGKMFYGNASVIGGWSAYNTDRHIAYGFTDKIAKNSHGGSQILSHLDTGINWNYLDLTIRPFDSFDYISQTENSYTEHNAGEWNLHVKQNNEIMIRNELGLQLAKCFCVWNSKWTISPKLSWIYESRVKGDHFIVNFVDEGTPFFIEGYFPDRSLFAPGLVMTGMMLRDALAFNLYYNGEFGSGYSNNTYGGQVRYAF